jgi:hypothetical protein
MVSTNSRGGPEAKCWILDSFDFDSTVVDFKNHFDSYYILSFILQSTRKDSWIDSNIKVNKVEVKIVSQRIFGGAIARIHSKTTCGRMVP